MMEMLTNLVTQSGVSATQLSAILLGVLFLIMIIGLATGQELAFVLGGAGVVIGYLAWGGPGAPTGGRGRPGTVLSICHNPSTAVATLK